jgi:4-amino-4-deoxy-L-arabinose transferase-like glycosyltransferase
VALIVLIAGVALGWSPLVPASIVAVGGLYAAQLALDDAPLDASAPLIAAGLLLVAELAYWSLEEREGVPGDPGDGLRHAAFVGVLAIGALVVGALLLVVSDVVSAEGLALDVVGAIAASAILAAVLLAARGRNRQVD